MRGGMLITLPFFSLFSTVAVKSHARGGAASRGQYFNKQRRNLTDRVTKPQSGKNGSQGTEEHSEVCILTSIVILSL